MSRLELELAYVAKARRCLDIESKLTASYECRYLGWALFGLTVFIWIFCALIGPHIGR